MRTLLYILLKNEKPKFLTEFNESDILLEEGDTLKIRENGEERKGMCTVTHDNYVVDIWGDKGDLVREIFLKEGE